MSTEQASSTPEAATAERSKPRGPLESSHWYGPLCIDNHAEVAARIERMLNGKFFTFVATSADSGVRSDVRTSQRLVAPVRVSRDGKYAHISCSDSNYAWGVHTTAQTLQDAWAQDRKWLVQLVFEHDRTLTIEHTSISGNHLYWVIAVEDHTDYDAEYESAEAASCVNNPGCVL